MRAELAAVHDDGVADRLALRVVGLQAPSSMSSWSRQRLRQRLRVGAGLGHAEAHVRPRVGGGVADHGDAADTRSRRGEIVDRRDEGLLDRHQRSRAAPAA